MGRRHRRDRRDRQGFIRWTEADRDRRFTLSPDPAFVVDRQRLYNYLDSLEGLSGE